MNPALTDAFMYLGIVLAKLNRHEEAVAALNRSLAANPSQLEALLCRGDSLMVIQRYADAVETFDRILSLNPTLVAVWMQKGTALDRLAKKQDALAAYTRSLRLIQAMLMHGHEKVSCLQTWEELPMLLPRSTKPLISTRTLAKYGCAKEMPSIPGRTGEAAEAYAEALRLDPIRKKAGSKMAGHFSIWDGIRTPLMPSIMQLP